MDPACSPVREMAEWYGVLGAVALRRGAFPWPFDVPTLAQIHVY